MIHAFLDTMDLDGNHVLDTEELIGVLNKKKEIGGGNLVMKKAGKKCFDHIFKMKIYNLYDAWYL